MIMRLGRGLFVAAALLAAAVVFAPRAVLAEACFPGTISSSPCTAGSVLVPDGPKVTGCPKKEDIFDGCSNKPGPGNVLCCMSKTTTGASSRSSCGPKDAESGAYACMFKELCAKEGAPYKVDSAKGDMSCNMTAEICCKIKVAATKTATPAKKQAAGQVISIFNPLGNVKSIPEILGRVINVFLGIVGAVALAVFVYGGIVWMTARGSQKQADSARGAIVNAVVGLAIIAFSYALANSVITMLTTMPVPPPEQLPSEQATQAETEKAQEQTSIQEQKAQEEQAQQQGAEQEAAKTACPSGYQCINGMSLSQMAPDKVSKSCVNANPMPGNPTPCGQSGMCCNF